MEKYEVQFIPLIGEELIRLSVHKVPLSSK